MRQLNTQHGKPEPLGKKLAASNLKFDTRSENEVLASERVKLASIMPVITVPNWNQYLARKTVVHLEQSLPI